MIQEDTIAHDSRYQNGLRTKGEARHRGHPTDPPSCLTYNSVVSRESVLIAFLIAAINRYDVMEVKNAYVQATLNTTPLLAMSLETAKAKWH
jgi:hypothetical protein